MSRVVYPWLEPLGRFCVPGDWSLPVGEGDVHGTHH